MAFVFSAIWFLIGAVILFMAYHFGFYAIPKFFGYTPISAALVGCGYALAWFLPPALAILRSTSKLTRG